MKTLTPATQTKKNALFNEPINLMEIVLSDTLTLYFSDRDISASVSPDGKQYYGRVKDWGAIAQVLSRDTGQASISDISIILDNSNSDGLNRVSGYFDEASFELKRVKVRQWFKGLGEDDLVLLFDGVISSPVNYDEDELTLDITDISVKVDQPIGEKILLNDFLYADPSAIGKIMPYNFGILEKIPCYPVKVAVKTTLRGSIIATDMSFEVNDASKFPSGSITILIDDEQITGSFTVNLFTVTARGANGTVASDHSHKVEVMQYLSEHIFLVCNGASKEISKVWIEDELQSPSAYSINLANTSLVAGKTLTTLSFANVPRVKIYSDSADKIDLLMTAVASGNNALDPTSAFDASNVTSSASINKDYRNLRIKNTVDYSQGNSEYGEILRAYLVIEHYAEGLMPNDSAVVRYDGGSDNLLSRPAVTDTVQGTTVDIDHSQYHSVLGNHGHTVNSDDGGSGSHLHPAGSHSVIGATIATFGGGNSSDELNKDNTWQRYNPQRMGYGQVTHRMFVCTVSNISDKVVKVTISMGGQSAWNSDIKPGQGWTYITHSDGGSFDDNMQNNMGGGSGIWIRNWGEVGSRCRVSEAYEQIEYIPESSATRSVWNLTGSDKNVNDVDPLITDDRTVNKTSTRCTNKYDITQAVAKNWSWFNNRQIQVDYNGSADGVCAFIIDAHFEVEYMAYRNMMSLNISCDTKGRTHNNLPSGTLLEKPVDIMKHIMTTIMELDETDYIDNVSFNATSVKLDNAIVGGYKWAFSIRETMQSKDFLAELAFQCRSSLFWNSSKYKLVFRELVPQSVVKSLTADDIESDSMAIVRTDMNEIYNDVYGYYKRDYGKSGNAEEIYDAVEVKDDSGSIAEYGWKVRNIELFTVREQLVAQDLTNFYLLKGREVRRQFTFRTWLNALEIERADVLGVTYPLLDNLSNAKMEIMDIRHIPGSGVAGRMDLLEINCLDLFVFVRQEKLIKYDTTINVMQAKAIKYDTTLQVWTEKIIKYDTKLFVYSEKTIKYDTSMEVWIEKTIKYDTKLIEVEAEKTIKYDTKLVAIEVGKTIKYDTYILTIHLWDEEGIQWDDILLKWDDVGG